MKLKTLFIALVCTASFSGCTEDDPNCTSDTCDYGECVNDECELWRDGFVKNYAGTIECGGQTDVASAAITAGVEDDELMIDGEMNVEVTGKTTFTIPSQTVTVDGQGVVVSGNGTLVNGTLTINYLIGVASCTYVGT